MRTDKLLLDTHAFLWWRADDARLLESARAESGHNRCRFELDGSLQVVDCLIAPAAEALDKPHM